MTRQKQPQSCLAQVLIFSRIDWAEPVQRADQAMLKKVAHYQSRIQDPESRSQEGQAICTGLRYWGPTLPPNSRNFASTRKGLGLLDRGAMKPYLFSLDLSGAANGITTTRCI